MSHSAIASVSFDPPRDASVLQGVAALLWLPQAAWLASAVAAMAQGADWRAAWAPAAGILTLGVLRASAEACGTRRMYAAARGHLARLRRDAVVALASRSPLDRERTPSGRAASLIAEQAEAIVPYLVRYQPARWKVALVPLAILALVAPLSWVAALILLVTAPLIPVFMALVGLGARAASRAQMVEMGAMNAFLLDRLRGLATLRALDAVEATARRLDASAQSLRRRTMAVLRIAFLSSAVLELFAALGVAMAAAYIGFSLLGTFNFGTWGVKLSLRDGMFILLLAPAFFEPLRELAAAWHDKAAGEAGLVGLRELAGAGLPLPGALAPSAPAVAGAPPAVELRELELAYPGEQSAFAPLSLLVRPGEHVALVGVSGGGKSSVLSLVAGLLPATSGEIRIAGQVLTDGNAGLLRRRIGWLGQHAHVFAATVGHNVALGRDASPGRLDAALRLAGLSAVAQARPGAVLEAGGYGLSGGEAVRLALARAALQPHADLLLVDEPTAHLDSETAARVTDALLTLAQGKTMLVATHDPVLAARLHRSVTIGAAPPEAAA